jgi:hypothetical protein
MTEPPSRNRISLRAALRRRDRFGPAEHVKLAEALVELTNYPDGLR